jgi:sterol 3beta-glucosyltransferase
MQIVILAVGTRGDVQPCVALGRGLVRAGHTVRLAAPDDLEAFVRDWGLEFFPLGVNMHALQETVTGQSLLKTGSNVVAGLRKMLHLFLPFLERMLESTWQACQGAEAILFSTLGMGAYHVADKLGVPCAWALIVPAFTRTRAFPSLIAPALPLGGGYNWLTHLLFEQFTQQSAGRFVNRWRRERLDLPLLPRHRWPYDALHGRPVPRLYSYSPAVIPRPTDWGPHAHITGYWYLDHPPEWQAPARLVDFLSAGPPPVYVGFGSLRPAHAEQTTDVVLAALRASGQRGLLATGWGALAQSDLPEDVLMIEAVPHDWLFPHVAAAVHHGGAGTTAAGLRAGVPSIVVPFGADQPFWAARVYQLGVGPRPIPHKKLTVERLTKALRADASDETLRVQAARLGERIRSENGVERAVEIVEPYLRLK